MACEVFIPFPGFYESWIDGVFDDEIEMQAEDLGVEEVDPTNCHIDFQRAAEEYLMAYADFLRSEVEATLCPPFLRPFSLKELIRPRFYNFETDRLLAVYEGSPSDLLLVRQLTTGLESLDKDIARRFQSRDGFASFYDDFVTDYRSKSIHEWDRNELSILLPEFGPEELMEDLREPLRDCVELRRQA